MLWATSAFRILSNIYHGGFFAKIVNGLKTLITCKNVPSYVFDNVLSTYLWTLQRVLRQCKVERKQSNRSSDTGAGDWEVKPFQPSVAFHIETSHLRHNRTHVSGSSYRIKSSQITTYLASYFVTAVGLQVMLPSKSQPHKMVKQTQTIRRLDSDKLFECVWPFCGVGA